MPAFQKAAGTIQNTTQPASTTNLQKSQWQQGLISPSLLGGTHLNQPAVFNGYLMVAGNEDFFFYDVSNATAPKQLSKMSTPNRRAGGEAESHTISFARAGDTFYMVTTGGTGIDTWDVTSVTAPKHLAQLKITGINYGDYTEAVWGVSWQGQYIYVGATNNGLKVVDATDPANLKIAAEVPTSSFGGVSAGPVDAIGNVLVVMTPKESAGIATLDISDPTKPTRLASLTSTTKSYITQFHRHYAVMLGPIRVWDVLTNPKSIGSGTSPIATINNEYAEYSAFSDDYLFIGHARQEISNVPGCSKITFSDPRSMKVVNRIYGRLDTTYNDDQFVLPFANLVVLTDDQTPYRGWVIAVHQTAPDTAAPVVDTVIPGNSSTGNSTKSRVGVTFSDNIELATVNAASFIVRPIGGQAAARPVRRADERRELRSGRGSPAGHHVRGGAAEGRDCGLRRQHAGDRMEVHVHDELTGGDPRRRSARGLVPGRAIAGRVPGDLRARAGARHHAQRDALGTVGGRRGARVHGQRPRCDRHRQLRVAVQRGRRLSARRGRDVPHVHGSRPVQRAGQRDRLDGRHGERVLPAPRALPADGHSDRRRPRRSFTTAPGTASSPSTRTTTRSRRSIRTSSSRSASSASTGSPSHWR